MQVIFLSLPTSFLNNLSTGKQKYTLHFVMQAFSFHLFIDWNKHKEVEKKPERYE